VIEEAPRGWKNMERASAGDRNDPLFDDDRDEPPDRTKGPRLALIYYRGHETSFHRPWSAWIDGTRVAERRNLAIKRAGAAHPARHDRPASGARGFAGTVIRPLDEHDVREKFPPRKIVARGASCVAALGLPDPVHERRVKEIIRDDTRISLGYPGRSCGR